MSARAEDYSILVGLDPVSDEYVAIVCEFPGLSWIASTKETAVTGLLSVLSDVLIDMAAAGEPIPVPTTPHLIPA
jgi:predicted RNase H-like HicB family nuclease